MAYSITAHIYSPLESNAIIAEYEKSLPFPGDMFCPKCESGKELLVVNVSKQIGNHVVMIKCKKCGGHVNFLPGNDPNADAGRP